jgi:predicted AlkP superfamily pyrophosphatase or phosphodiesterase
MLALWVSSQVAIAQQVKHVILISIDAFRPEFYMDRSWPVPTLHRMMDEGIYAESVKPVFPSVTYPNHVSMVTGTVPSKHGIYYNRPFQPVAKATHTAWESSFIQTPTLWDAIDQAGLTSAAFLWPVTYGAPIHYNVPTVWKDNKDLNRVAIIRQQTNPPELWEELEQQMNKSIKSKDISDAMLGVMASYVIEQYKPSLTAIHLGGADHAQHKGGTNSNEVRSALIEIDQVIVRLIQAVERAGIKDSTAFLIVGDHGFCDVHESLSPNVWLRKSGLYKNNTTKWTAKFQTANGAAFLYLQNPDDEKVIRQIRKMLKKLPSRQKELFRVMEREELIAVGADPKAMLAINPIQGVSIKNTSKGRARTKTQGGAHGYYPDFPGIMSGFIGWGAGVQSGKMVAELRVQDIAPMVAKLLNLDFMTDDDGIFLDLFNF